MAYRVGAGDAAPFRFIDYTTTTTTTSSTTKTADARGSSSGLLLRPPSRGHNQRHVQVVYDDYYSEYDSDETSPHPRSSNVAWEVFGHGQRHDRMAFRDRYNRGGGGVTTPEQEWSPDPAEQEQHQFFVIREGTPSPVPGAPFPAPLPSRDAVQLQPHHHLHFHHPQHQHHHPQHHHHRDGHASANNNSNRSPPPVACSMERTPSGRTILTENTATVANQQLALECAAADFSPEEDQYAALQVKWHMAKPRQNVKRHERILRALIHPKPHAAKGTEFPLDNDALESIFSAADEIFFQGRLSRRVHWEWSSFDSSPASTTNEEGMDGPASHSISKGGDGIIGTTALRRASPPSRGGYETLIVLSSPILMDTGYNRRLLISTFLHELIHSYLFICCGFKARHCGGHTEGFKEIAAMIDGWAGRGTLRLCDMEADLEHFRERGDDNFGEYHGERSMNQWGQNQHQHQHQHHHHHRQQQPQQHYHHYQNYQQQQREPPKRRYHHHGGVDFYDLNASPWSTGPRVIFGNGHHITTSTIDPSSLPPPLPLGLSPSSTSPPPLLAGGCWNSSYPPPTARTRTPLSSPTPPPSMSTTPLSSATTLIGSDSSLSFHGGAPRDEVIMYDYDRCDGMLSDGGIASGEQQQSHHQQQQQYCHMFNKGPEIKFFSSPPM